MGRKRTQEIQRQEVALTMFIKDYIITNYETTKHQGRAGQTNQQSCEAAEKIAIESESDRIFKKRIWGITSTGISLCSRSGKADEGIASARGERSCSCKITGEHEQKNSETEKEKERKYQWDYDRVVKGIPKTKWHIRRNVDEWNLNMNLIG